MKPIFTASFLFFALSTIALQAQVSKDATVPLIAAVGTNPVSITLNWPNPAASRLLILRRTKGQSGNQWIQLLDATNSTQTSLTDNNVAVGQIYEYVIQRTTNINAYGYAHVAIDAPATDNRGKMLLFVDSDISGVLAPELERLRLDLIGDGWQVVEHATGAASTVQSVKGQIIADYNADPANVKAVFLLGKIPVPYSGNAAWDGHGDHQGAWPADAWYADVDGAWTDTLVNNTTPGRVANRNVPGDGKFDQSFLPSPVELQVGRVDFRRLTPGVFGATTVELLRRYLDKNHAWRTGAYQVDNKALVDDNFGYFGGEAFAANGFRNAYPLVGEANVVAADFFDNTNPQRYLLGYGTGPGSYTSAGGVGNSTNFATDTIHIVFSNLFGSYHGDWDYETNPFMPSALASQGGILTCAWAGRPHHFYQALASGQSIGYCMWETQNAQFNNGFFPSLAESGAHVSLLGDPTLRAHIVPPPSDPTAVSGCGRVLLEWKASPDIGVVGYHVYRSLSQNGVYTRLTVNAINGTTFVDNGPSTDTLHYQIKAVKRQTSPGGGAYFNTSTGAMVSHFYAPPAPPTVSVSSTVGVLTCIETSTTLTAVSNPPGASFLWSGPDDFSANSQNVTVETPGNYWVTVTFSNGCTNVAATTVLQDVAAPPFGVVVSGSLTCANPSATIELVLPSGVCACSISGPGGLFTPTHMATVTQPGSYTLKTVYCATGCTTTQTINIAQDVTPPGVSAIGGTITCDDPDVALQGESSATNATYHWTGPCITPADQFLQNPLVYCSGTYTLTVTNAANGCTNETTVIVDQDTNPPGLPILTPLIINCIATCAMFQLPDGPAIEFYLDGQLLPPGEPVIFCDTGTYSFVARSVLNGCTQDYPVEVVADLEAPGASVDDSIHVLSCLQSIILLQGSSQSPNVEFSWATPDGNIVSGNALPTCAVNAAGTYILTVTNADNGCTSTDQAQVVLGNDGPDVSLMASGTLTCANLTVVLQGSSNTPGVIFSWIGIEFPPAQPTALVSVPGAYTLMATALNGCTGTATVVVAQDTSSPVAAISSTDESAPGIGDGTASVMVASGSGTYTYEWSNGQNTPVITHLSGGTYTVTVTDVANGCTTVESVVVETTVGTSEASLFRSLSLSPNPTEGLALLTLSLQQSVPVRVTVYDATGRVVWEKPEALIKETHIPIDLRGNAPGIYTVVVWAGDQAAVRKLAVAM